MKIIGLFLQAPLGCGKGRREPARQITGGPRIFGSHKAPKHGVKFSDVIKSLPRLHITKEPMGAVFHD